MKAKFVIAVAAALIVTCAVLTADRNAVADESSAVASSAVLASIGADEQKHEFEGSKSCKKCHIKVFKSWEDLAHGKALESLQPGNNVEEKQKHNLDPQKDYSTDAECLKCHTTGFGMAGGYEVPTEGDKKAEKKAKELADVGCESCHGPAQHYIEVFDQIMKEKRTYTVDELKAVGLVQPTAEVCMECHTETHPTFDPDDKFDYDKMKETGVHEHEELKLRQG